MNAGCMQKQEKAKRSNLGKTRSSESILKKKGAKNANFPENRVPWERILKTGEDRGLFGKKTRLKRLF